MHLYIYATYKNDIKFVFKNGWGWHGSEYAVPDSKNDTLLQKFVDRYGIKD